MKDPETELKLINASYDADYLAYMMKPLLFSLIHVLTSRRRFIGPQFRSRACCRREFVALAKCVCIYPKFTKHPCARLRTLVSCSTSRRVEARANVNSMRLVWKVFGRQ